jgi:hypothetical protein
MVPPWHHTHHAQVPLGNLASKRKKITADNATPCTQRAQMLPGEEKLAFFHRLQKIAFFVPPLLLTILLFKH